MARGRGPPLAVLLFAWRASAGKIGIEVYDVSAGMDGAGGVTASCDQTMLSNFAFEADGACTEAITKDGPAPKAGVAYCSDGDSAMFFDFGSMASGGWPSADDCTTELTADGAADAAAGLTKLFNAGSPTQDAVDAGFMMIPYGVSVGDCVLFDGMGSKKSALIKQWPCETDAPPPDTPDTITPASLHGATCDEAMTGGPVTPTVEVVPGLTPSGFANLDALGAACTAKHDEMMGKPDSCPGACSYGADWDVGKDPTECYLICCPCYTEAPTTAAPTKATEAPVEPATDGSGSDAPPPTGPSPDDGSGSGGGGGGGGGNPPPNPPPDDGGYFGSGSGPPPPPASACGNGVKDPVSGCCTCNKGWADDNDADPVSPCSKCAPGFQLSEGGGFCTDGRPGSECSDTKPAPFGCKSPDGYPGKCTAEKNGKKMKGKGNSAPDGWFPCTSCSNAAMDPASSCSVLAREAGADGAAGTGALTDAAVAASDPDTAATDNPTTACLPSGAHMMTPFPNEPQVYKQFSLVIVGCNDKVTTNLFDVDSHEFLIIPALKKVPGEDPPRYVQNKCQDISLADIDERCVFTKENSTDGITIPPGMSVPSHRRGSTLGRHFDTEGKKKKKSKKVGTDYQGNDYALDDTYDCSQWDADKMNPCATGFLCRNCAVKPAEGSGSAMSELIIKDITYADPCVLGGSENWARNQQKLCRRLPDRSTGGTDKEELWDEIDAHDHWVTQRNTTFTVADGYIAPTQIRGAAMGDEGLGEVSDEECCNGLKIGDGCLPLIIFLLLWLLMAALLALLACSMYKTHKDIDAEKNNTKFQAFSEMQDVINADCDDDL